MSVAQAAVGAAWLGVAWTTLQREADEERRQLNEMNDTLLKTARDQRERLHELRSTVAGLVTGSALLDRPDAPGRDSPAPLGVGVPRARADGAAALRPGRSHATDLDLDQTLGLILDLQRLKGRRVEFHSSGDSVCARYDALAEVVNILMDNAVDARRLRQQRGRGRAPRRRGRRHHGHRLRSRHSPASSASTSSSGADAAPTRPVRASACTWPSG